MPILNKAYRNIPFDPHGSRHWQAAADVWNGACGAGLAISPAFVCYNTRPVTGVEQQGLLVYHAETPVGFALASYELGNPTPLLSSLMNQGWIDAIAVLPGYARQGIGGDLVAWAQTWLVSKGCKLIHLGGSMRPFAPGLPIELSTQAFFLKLGFADRGPAWDVSQDLAGYQPRSDPRLGQVQPLSLGQIEVMRDFLRREFPDRWSFEFEEAVRAGDRLSDYQALWVGDRVEGMLNLTFEDSSRPLERYYMAGLPTPWGQLGTVAVSAGLRGQGYGALLMVSGLTRLKAAGVRGCVIDWTGLVDFYGKFGFKPYRQYTILEKDFYL